MTDEQLNKIEEYGRYGFSPQRVARLLDMQWIPFKELFEPDDSPLKAAYEKGWYLGEYERAKAKQDAAAKGNLTAIQMIDRDSKEQYLKRRKEEIFGRVMES